MLLYVFAYVYIVSGLHLASYNARSGFNVLLVGGSIRHVLFYKMEYRNQLRKRIKWVTIHIATYLMKLGHSVWNLDLWLLYNLLGGFHFLFTEKNFLLYLKKGLSGSENNAIMILKTVTIHDYEYYHDSYMVSISVHDWRQRNMQLSSIINVRLPLSSEIFVAFSIKFCR